MTERNKEQAVRSELIVSRSSLICWIYSVPGRDYKTDIASKSPSTNRNLDIINGRKSTY